MLRELTVSDYYTLAKRMWLNHAIIDFYLYKRSRVKVKVLCYG